MQLWPMYFSGVQQKMFRAANVSISCSSSGKLTQSHVKYWADNVYNKFCGDKSLLLLDSWTGQKKDSLFSGVHGCRRMTIPPNTTSIAQPLDVFFNRQWKVYVRTMHNRVQLDDIPISLSSRDNIIKMTSLVHNQLSAPAYKTMIKYAWHASGYLEKHPGEFKTVKDVAFAFTNSMCSVPKCNISPFIQCSHCSHVLCFQHFFTDFHFHSL